MLGGRLVELRKERKLTQVDVAKRLHLTRSTYAQYEVDRRVPEYATLQKLADFYGVTIDYLVGRSEIRKEINHEAAQDLIDFLTDKRTTIDGEPIPQSFIDDIVGYVRIRMAMDKDRQQKGDS